MNLLTKGLLLIAIPSVLELGVLGLLLDKQEDATRTQTWELHSRQVIDQAATLIEPLLRESSRVYGAAITGSTQPLVDDEPWKDFDRRLASLSSLVADDPLQLARLSAIGSLAKQYREWVGRYTALVGAGEPSGYVPMLRPDNDGDVLLERMHASIGTFSAQEDALHNARGRTLDRLRDIQKSGLILAALGSILITVLSAFLFTRHISLRLATLGENAQRVADGLELASPIKGKDEIAALDAIVHDTSRRLNAVEREHRDLSDELRERGAQLIEVNQHLVAQTSENETFVYGVSHDLRSPLVNLQGFSKELLVSCASLREDIERSSMSEVQRAQVRQLVDGEFAESLHFLQNAVMRATNIVDALLRLSRVGRLDYQWRQVRVDAIVERVVSAMRQTMRERGAEITVRALPSVWGDATTIEQIFANLIGNALNYLDPARAGRIEVGVKLEPVADAQAPRRPTHVFYVRDNGLGIPERYLPKMFSAFQRLHGNVAKGEGIGLALVRRMVERHGGRVWLESKEGEGSTFFVELPAEAPRDAAGRDVRARSAEDTAASATSTSETAAAPAGVSGAVTPSPAVTGPGASGPSARDIGTAQST
ncbi:histidine kinase [Pararobbsia alpina]|uniref:sensor histidine kinase n=1 Tax=Pararobbsia alpina TaxID=621374 RepID=UPI0039A44A7E